MKTFKQLTCVLLYLVFAVLSAVQAGPLQTGIMPRVSPCYKNPKCHDDGGGIGKRQELVKRQLRAGPKYGRGPCDLKLNCHDDIGRIGKRQVFVKREIGKDGGVSIPCPYGCGKVSKCPKGCFVLPGRKRRSSLNLLGENDIVAREEGQDSTAGHLIKRNSQECVGGCEENQNCVPGCIHHRRDGLSDSGALLERGFADDESVKDLGLRDIKYVGGGRRQACPTGCKKNNSCPRRCDPLKKREGSTEGRSDAIDRVRSTSSVQDDSLLLRREVAKSTLEGKLQQRDDNPCTWPNCGESHSHSD